MRHQAMPSWIGSGRRDAVGKGARARKAPSRVRQSERGLGFLPEGLIGMWTRRILEGSVWAAVPSAGSGLNPARDGDFGAAQGQDADPCLGRASRGSHWYTISKVCMKAGGRGNVSNPPVWAMPLHSHSDGDDTNPHGGVRYVIARKTERCGLSFRMDRLADRLTARQTPRVVPSGRGSVQPPHARQPWCAGSRRGRRICRAGSFGRRASFKDCVTQEQQLGARVLAQAIRGISIAVRWAQPLSGAPILPPVGPTKHTPAGRFALHRKKRITYLVQARRTGIWAGSCVVRRSRYSARFLASLNFWS